jgi:hypothetical protein
MSLEVAKIAIDSANERSAHILAFKMLREEHERLNPTSPEVKPKSFLQRLIGKK